jgi:hypothetical protein
VPHCIGGHFGADPLIKADMFVGESAESIKLNIKASVVEGAYAVAVGEAMWRSVKENRPVMIRDLLGNHVV